MASVMEGRKVLIQKRFGRNSGHQVTRYGLWGYKSCISKEVVVDGKSCGSDANPRRDYPDCGDDRDCKEHKYVWRKNGISVFMLQGD
jgi:hypothetical protein